MDAAIASAKGESAIWTPLIDVSDMATTELLANGNLVLARTVQRLVRSLDDPDGVISAFQSFAS